MDTTTKRQKLHEYIDTAENDKVDALYTILEHDVKEPYEWWNDEELCAELDRRSADFASGKDKGVPWEEVKKELLSRRKK